jgi:hypothetical protein
MLETKQQGRSSVPIDPDTHAECLEFIRAAISASDREFAEQIAKILKDVCQKGHADRATRKGRTDGDRTAAVAIPTGSTFDRS